MGSREHSLALLPRPVRTQQGGAILEVKNSLTRRQSPGHLGLGLPSLQKHEEFPIIYKLLRLLQQHTWRKTGTILKFAPNLVHNKVLLTKDNALTRALST